MFDRPHHRLVARVLEALDGDVLAEHRCWFGGGTALALAHGEYRESVDIDLLVSDREGYKALRALVGRTGLAGLTRRPLVAGREIRSDAYGIIRTAVLVDDAPIKLEVVHEGRISFDAPAPGSTICGVRVLAPVDQVATKLLANDDRWADRSVFSGDLIDLAMMKPDSATLAAGLAKAESAYGATVRESLGKAVALFRDHPRLIEKSRRALSMDLSAAAILEAVHRLSRRVAALWGRQGTSPDPHMEPPVGIEPTT